MYSTLTPTERALDLANGLASAIHPHTSVCRPTLMLKFYIDESEDQDRLGVMAGYIAHTAMWDDFTKKWQELLDKAKAEVFHATDFFGCYGEFGDWRPGSKRHKRFGRQFTAG